jgi:hypothetical protein
MASNYKHTKTVSDSLKVKGEVSKDGMYITYEEDKQQHQLNIAKAFKAFAGEVISLSLTSKEEMDLDEE